MSETYYLDFSDKNKVIADFYKVSIHNQFFETLEDGSREAHEIKFEDITDKIDKIEVTLVDEVKIPEDKSKNLYYTIIGYKDGTKYNLIPAGKIARKISYDRVWCDGQVRLVYRIYVIDTNSI